MKFSYTQNFPKDAGTVLSMFCDPAYHEQLQTKLGAWDIQQLDHSDDGTTFRIKLKYLVKAEAPLPGFAKKILGDSSEVEHTESWNRDSQSGQVDINVKTLPGTLSCQTSIQDSGSGSQKTFNWDVNVKVPLVGGKLEKLVSEDIKGKSAPEEAAGIALLDNY